MSASLVNQLVARGRQEVVALREPRHRQVLAGRVRARVFLRLAPLRGLDVRAGQGLRFTAGKAPIFAGPGAFRFGDHCGLRGDLGRSRLATADGGRIVFGNRVGFNYGLEIHSSVGVEIGDNTIGGARVTIYDTNFHQVDATQPIKTAPVRIGKNVWLGHGCTILPGVTIGDGAVIGTGAVISRDVPPLTLMVGNPAKPVRELTAPPDWTRW